MSESQAIAVPGSKEKARVLLEQYEPFGHKCMRIFKNWNDTTSKNKKTPNLINTILIFLEQKVAAIASVWLERLAGYLLPFTFMLWLQCPG